LEIEETLVGFETRHLVTEFAQALQMGLRHAREDRRVVGAAICMTHGMAGREVGLFGELGIDEFGVGVVLPHRLHPPLVAGGSFVRIGQREADFVVRHDPMGLRREQFRSLPLRWHPVFETRQLRVRRAVGVLEHPVAEPSGPPKLKEEFAHPSTAGRVCSLAVAVPREALLAQADGVAGMGIRDAECGSVVAWRPSSDAARGQSLCHPCESVRACKHMSPSLTIQTNLILACARTDPDVQRIRDLVERGPDWQCFLRKTERWGLAPLVYNNLRQAAPPGQVPMAITERLRHLSHRDTTYGIVRREEL